MNSKQFLALALVLSFVMTGCGRQNETIGTTTEVIATTETPATIEVTIPGLEDSVFDDETQFASTENTESIESINPTESVQPDTTMEPTQAPTVKQLDYERFHNMSAAEQQAVMASFDSIEAFFNWYNQIKAEYEAANPPIDVGDGNVDMGDLLG